MTRSRWGGWWLSAGARGWIGSGGAAGLDNGAGGVSEPATGYATPVQKELLAVAAQPANPVH